MKHILIIGATGQIGSELTMELRRRYGNTNVVAGYIQGAEPKGELKESGPSAVVDVTNGEMIESDTHDAGTGDSKPLFLCSQYVSYLHRTAVVIGLCIRTGIDTVNRFFGCILPRNTDFYPLAGDLSGSYGKRKDKEIARQGS